MNIKHLFIVVGSLMLFIGIYLFPFGQDWVIYNLTEMTGSYWNGILLLYIICSALIVFGFVFIKYGAVIIGNPVYLVMLLIAIIVAFFMFNQIFVSVSAGGS